MVLKITAPDSGAISAGSRKINGAYQDVLTWARQIGEAKTFMEQLKRAASSNPDMRTFVETFRTHLRDFGVANDDETVGNCFAACRFLSSTSLQCSAVPQRRYLSGNDEPALFYQQKLRGPGSRKFASATIVVESYFRRFKHTIPMLPALLPGVWLYWDPKTVLERGKNALLRFRMDFLMLFPNGVRIVIEVDGKHHFSDASGQPSPQKYAQMVAADRDLRLVEYDVYRFGAVELSAKQGFHQASDFFDRLFRLYKLSVYRKLSTQESSPK